MTIYRTHPTRACADADQSSMSTAVRTARCAIKTLAKVVLASALMMSAAQAQIQMRTVVTFGPGTTSADINLFLAQWATAGVSATMRLPLINGAVLSHPPSVTRIDLVNDPLVQKASSDFSGVLLLPDTSTDSILEIIPGVLTTVRNTAVGLLASLDYTIGSLLNSYRPWGVLDLYEHPYDRDAAMDRLDAWRLPSRVVDATANSWRVKIAVFDTGIDFNHSRLAGRVKGGIDVVNFTPGIPSDKHGHGTHVAGTVAAKGVGLATSSNLYSVKILGDDGGGRLTNLLMALQWAVDNDIDVVNMSIGFKDDNPLVREAIKNAQKAGIVLVAAVGNHSNWIDTGASGEGASGEGASGEGASGEGASGEGASDEDCLIYSSGEGASGEGASGEGASGEGASVTACATGPLYSVMYPGAYPETIAVSAHDQYGVEAWFANTGPETDLMAPGMRVVSILPGNNYGALNGTSMATPYVTGAVALMIAYAKEYNRVFTPDDIKQILSANSSGGMIDLVGALKAVRKLPGAGLLGLF